MNMPPLVVAAYALIALRHAPDHSVLASEVARDMTETSCLNQADSLNALESRRVVTTRSPRLMFVCVYDGF